MEATLGTRIYNLRKKLGLTCKEVGDKIGVTKQTIGRYESGDITNIPYDKVVSLAKLFGVHPSELLGFDDVQLTDVEGRRDARLLAYYHMLTDSQQQFVMSLVESYLKE